MPSRFFYSRRLRDKLLRATLSPLLLAALGGALLLTFPQAARADESPFGFLYTAEVLPKGAVEVEQWMTWRTSKPGEDFYRLMLAPRS